MTAREFCWWLYRYHRPTFDALAYAGLRVHSISSLVTIERIAEESTGHPIVADVIIDGVLHQVKRVDRDMPAWAPFIRHALAPTAISAYRWAQRRTYPSAQGAGLMQLVPSTFGGDAK